ncbi:MAG: SPOR domain-containing protein [Methylophilus sp.]|nr:SPOR domain-containing protein [Methylophilus sp.]
MTKDYKPSPPRSEKKGNPFLSGLLVGLLLGVGASVGLTIYLKGDSSPFLEKGIKQNTVAEKSGKKKVSEETIKPNSPDDKTLQDPNKFDFYTILPETESKVTEQEVKNATTIKKDSYFLQVGAFENEDDADNMKAKLALQGFEAVVQSAEIPGKGVWHRVRVGPLSDVEQINKVRGDLTLNGFNADLIKVHTEATTN